MLWINKITSVDQGLDPSLACMRLLFNFYNPSGSAVRHLTIASSTVKNLGTLAEDKQMPRKTLTQQLETLLDERLAREMMAKVSRHIAQVDVEPGPSIPTLPDAVDDKYISLLREKRFEINEEDHEAVYETEEAFEYEDDYYSTRQIAFDIGEDDDWIFEDDVDDDVDDDDDDDWEYFDQAKADEEASKKPELIKVDEGVEVINEKEKLLIFTTGDRCSIPHQVGIRRMSSVRFRSHMDVSKTLAERIEERRRKQREARRREHELGEFVNWSHYPAVSHLFDAIDVVFEFNSRVVGLALSPDCRFEPSPTFFFCRKKDLYNTGCARSRCVRPFFAYQKCYYVVAVFWSKLGSRFKNNN